MASGETKQPQEESRSEHTINTLRQELINVNNDIITLADAIRDTLETRQWKTITGFPARLTKLESYKKELELKLHKQEALPFVDLYELARTTYGANDEPNTTLIAFWRLIFEFKGTSEKDIRGLTYSCRLFKDALKNKMELFTTFPNPNYDVSFGVFMNVLNKNALLHPNNSPKWLFVANGVHEIEVNVRFRSDEYPFVEEEVNMVFIKINISIIGESREHCIFIGGLLMEGKLEDDVKVSNLTLRDAKGTGVHGRDGASIHLDNVSVENSGYHGVYVWGTKRSTMKNCNVSHSKRSGLLVNNGGLMTIDGNGTTIHHNCTFQNSDDYGLDACDFSSSIHLVSPLTIETISTNNGGGGNYNSQGTIKTITTNEPKNDKSGNNNSNGTFFGKW